MMTESQKELACAAWLASTTGCGLVLADDEYPNAHALTEKGWLERRFEPDGELSWWWTAQAETALALSGLAAEQNPN